MAKDPTNAVNFYMCIEASRKNDLGSIRNWPLLKIAYEEEQLWVKDLSAAQIDSVEIQSIPFKKIYYTQDTKLFPIGSLLPERNLPSLLWTSIDRGLPLQLPSYNHNYFGLSEKLHVKLVPSDRAYEAFAMLTDLSTLQSYILSAPAVRLENLDWVLVGKDKALILRTPLLPIQGSTFWNYNSFLIPSGYDFEYHSLNNTLELLLNPEQDQWIVWNMDSNYYSIPKRCIEALSISSFRQSTLPL